MEKGKSRGFLSTLKESQNAFYQAFLFSNPYGNDKRKTIYDFVREANLPYLCFDRGALSDVGLIFIKSF